MRTKLLITVVVLIVIIIGIEFTLLSKVPNKTPTIINPTLQPSMGVVAQSANGTPNPSVTINGELMNLQEENGIIYADFVTTNAGSKQVTQKIAIANTTLNSAFSIRGKITNNEIPQPTTVKGNDILPILNKNLNKPLQFIVYLTPSSTTNYKNNPQAMEVITWGNKFTDCNNKFHSLLQTSNPTTLSCTPLLYQANEL